MLPLESQRVFQNLLLFCFAIIITTHLMTVTFGTKNPIQCKRRCTYALSRNKRKDDTFFHRRNCHYRHGLTVAMNIGSLGVTAFRGQHFRRHVTEGTNPSFGLTRSFCCTSQTKVSELENCVISGQLQEKKSTLQT